MPTIDSFVNRIIHGDCIELMRTMPKKSVDLVVTDPPYVVNYRSRDGRTHANENNTRWMKPAFAEIYRVLKEDSFCVSFYGWHKVERFMDAWKDAGFTPVSHFVWVKQYHSKKGFTRAHHENAYLLAKGNPSKPAEAPCDVLDWVYTQNRLHPTQKPVSGLVPLIAAYSKPGDIVLDPFAGSGTTAVAAQQLGRSYVAIEKLWQYYQKARDRVQAQGGEDCLTTNLKEETMSNQPTHHVYYVKDKENTEKGIWTKIGAAWPHKDKKGFSLELELIPVSSGGTLNLTLREATEKEPAEGSKQPQAA